MTVHVSLMHAPWSDRGRYVRAAAAACAHPSITSFVVVEDTNREGVWPTARRAWQAGAASGAAHVLVLQDDVHLCHAFPDNLGAVIAARPAHLLSLFSMGRGAVLQARERGVSWAWGPDAAYGQALLMPREEVARFLEWESVHVRPEYPHDDNRVAMYARCSGQGLWVPCPNLVQHGEPAASLLGHSNRHRVARWYDPTPAHVDWSRGLDAPVRLSATVDPRPILRDPSKATPPCAPDPMARLVAEARRDPHLRGCIRRGQAHEPMCLDGRVVGFVTPHEDTLGWRAGPAYVTPLARGRGVLRAFYDAHPGRVWVAAVKEDNAASQRAHERAGFVRWRRCPLGWMWRREAR